MNYLFLLFDVYLKEIESKQFFSDICMPLTEIVNAWFSKNMTYLFNRYLLRYTGCGAKFRLKIMADTVMLEI